MNKFLMALAVLGGVGLISIFTTFYVLGRDIPPPDFSDLAVVRTEVPPEDNAYTYFNSATNTFYRPAEPDMIIDYLAGKPVEPGAMAEVFSKNEQAFEDIRRGVACSKCVTPEITSFLALMPHLSPWMAMSRILAAQTLQSRLTGRYPEATESCITLLRFGNLILREPECLIQYLVGIGALELGLTQARDLAFDKKMPAAELNRLAAALAELGPLTPGYIRSIKTEFRMAANTIDMIKDGKLNMEDLESLSFDSDKPNSLLKRKRVPRYLFQPNKTKLAFANLYRSIISDAPLAFAEMKRVDAEVLLDLKKHKLLIFMRPNAVGKILTALLAPALDRVIERKIDTDCNISATRLLVACHQYQKMYGRFPDDLESLTPAFLSSIPTDPYDGKAFKYDAAKGIVYAAGKDLRDSGGSNKMPIGITEENPARARFRSEDVVYELEPAPAPSTPSE